MTLTHFGLVIVGTCTKCRFVIWGTGEPQTEHSYCGVTRPNK